MHGNYRHHYLLLPTAGTQSSSPPPTTSLSSAPQSSKSRQQQQMANNFNGLPASSSNGKPQRPQASAGNYSTASKQPVHEFQASDRLIDSQRLNGRYFTDQQQQLQLQLQHQHQLHQCQQQVRAPNGSRQQLIHEHNGIGANNNHITGGGKHTLHQKYLQQQQFGGAYYEDEDDDTPLSNGHHNRDNYASQIRNSRLQHNFQQQPQASQSRQFSPAPMQQHQQARGSGSSSHQQPGGERPQTPDSACSGSPLAPSSSSGGQQQYRKSFASSKEDRSLHVNFNRANRAADDDEGDSRKKKYLTAKYGQQQMNLIKKRLKIEMWLCEQLKELAKGSKSEAELEEIDIDLDQLLDMDDDETRRRWLKKTLEPFEDLPENRIGKFIDDVLDQSKLL